MKTRIIALFAGLLAVLPMTSVWAGGGGTTETFAYYATLQAKTSPTGVGKVYVGTSQTAPGDSFYQVNSHQATASAESSGDSANVQFYAFVTGYDSAAYKFLGWSTSETGSVLQNSAKSPYSYSITSSDKSETPSSVTTLFARFESLSVDPYTVTFKKPDGGSYLVGEDEITADTETGTLNLPKQYVLKSNDPNFLAWNINGTLFSDNPHTLACTANTIVSAQFLTEAMKTTAATFDAVDTALKGDAYREITIPADAEITIAKGATLTVPAGKRLVVNGTLVVFGSLSCAGAASGNIEKVVLELKQDELVRTDCAQATYDPGSLAQLNYYKSELVDVASKIDGATANKEVLVLTRNGELITSTSWAVGAKPKALYCSNDATVAINCITSIDEHIAKPEDKQGDKESAAWWSGSKVAVLLSNWTLSYKDKTAAAGKYIGYVDCCQSFTISHSVEVGALYLKTVNAKKVSFTGKTTNLKIWYVNCSAFQTKFPDTDASGAPNFHFYDCPAAKAGKSGSDGSAYPSSWPQNVRAHFYSGSFPNATLTTGKCIVHGGTFKSDPNGCIENAAIAAYQDSSKNWVVQKKVQVKPLIGTTEYDTLAAAVAAVPEGGATPTTIKLTANLTLASDLIVPAGKNVTIELDGASISGGKIVNNGTLRIEDSSPNDEKGTVSSAVENNGVLEITYGNYSGNFLLNENSKLITHNGKFTGTISTAANPLSVAELRGGNFKQGNIGDFLDAEAGYVTMSYNSGYSVGKPPADYAVVTVDNPSSATPTYTIKALSDENLNVYKKGVDRSLYTDKEWYLKAELTSALEPYLGRTVDIVITGDRLVAKGSISVNVLSPYVFDNAIDRELKKGEEYRILSQKVADMGYYQLGYRAFLNGDYTTLKGKVSNKGGLENIGMTVNFDIVLCTGAHSGNPDLRADLSNLKTVYTVVNQPIKFTGLGAIAGNTDYTSLAAALEAVNYSGTVKLSKDCSETIKIERECSFTLDRNNFEFTGAITTEGNYIVKCKGQDYTVVKAAENLAEVEITTTQGESQAAKVSMKVEADWVEKVEANGKTIAEALKETEENGLKVWENKLLERASDGEKATKVVVQVVEKTVGEQNVIETRQTEVDTSKGYDQLAAGTYRQAFTVKDDAGNEVKIADTDPAVKSIAVVRKQSSDKTVILPVPGEKIGGIGKVCIDDVIKVSSLMPNDVVTYYDGTAKMTWTYKGEEGWSEAKDTVTIPSEGEVGKKTSGGTASTFELPAGGAFWLTRANDNPTPIDVVMVAEVPKTFESKAMESGKWNLEANPNPTVAKALSQVVKESAAGDQVVIPTANGAQKKVLRGSDGTWKHKRTYIDKNGEVKVEYEDAMIEGGQGFWYISGGQGEASIQW